MTMVEQKYWEPGERSSYGGEYTNIDGWVELWYQIQHLERVRNPVSDLALTTARER